MTLILAAPDSDIHRCPSCGANCAVDHEMLAAAALCRPAALAHEREALADAHLAYVRPRRLFACFALRRRAGCP